MSENGFLKRSSEFYEKHPGLIGALYCIVPTVSVYGFALAFVSFRQVYLLRLGLSVVIGGAVGAWISRFGVSLWMIKHRSVKGPITLLDGALIGAATGAGIGFLPPLTALIASSNMERTKSIIMVVWVIVPVVGAIIGTILAAIGRTYVSREWPVEAGEQK